MVQLVSSSCSSSSLCSKDNGAHCKTAHPLKKKKDTVFRTCYDTSDAEHHGGLCYPESVLNDDLVLPGVLGSNPEDEYGAHSAHIGNMVVGVCVQADVVAVPRHTWHGVAFHCAAHAALVTLRGCALPQWDDERWT